MKPTSVIALFCEDIREEKSGAFTLIGLLPDNIEFKAPDPAAPQSDQRFLTKLCVYVRTNFDPGNKLGGGEIHLVPPDKQRHLIGKIEGATVALAGDQARENGSPIAGIISRAMLAGFQGVPVGRFDVEVTLGNKTYLAGSINFTIADAISSTDSPQPSLQ